MSVRTQTLEPRLSSYLEEGLSSFAPAELARAVLKLSDFYNQNVGSHTPWNESFAEMAYLSYFLPLNVVRATDAFRDLKRFLPRESVEAVWDFGSGLGTTQFALEAMGWTSGVLHAQERSKSAMELHSRLSQELGSQWKLDFNLNLKPKPGDLAVFSYSFLEMQEALPELEAFDHILILEPSLRERSRELMRWRGELLKRGFRTLAPCTHDEACPLLELSQKDWCHFRVHFDAPEWFQEIEAHLPMKNRTLTYSYLLLSRTHTDSEWRGQARAIGDTLFEAGKIRQMICRGPKREFLTWLTKKGEPPMISSGALIRGQEKAESKAGGLELRPELGSLTWDE